MAGLLEMLAATWPPLETAEAGGFLLRRGAGGGNRTSAASLAASLAPDGPEAAGIAAAAAGMRAWGQRPLFLVTPGQEALDAALAARGYRLHDPSVLLAAPVATLAEAGPHALPCTAPLAAMVELWAAGGIGAERLAVMARASGPKSWFLGRHSDSVAGCGFAAVHAGVVMLHALEIAPGFRRRGVGAALTRGAAAWGGSAGAGELQLAVTTENAPALALYARLGLGEVLRYHYRRHPDAA